MNIIKIQARQILDSRGNPTVEADVILDNGVAGRASVPSGASIGMHEDIELRDKDYSKFLGNGVLKAVLNINTKINDLLVNSNPQDQDLIDKKLIGLDGTESKSNLGANAILAVSLASAKAAALSTNLPLYKYFAKLVNLSSDQLLLPLPMVNIINGGKHASWATDIQEYMIMPIGAKTFSEALRTSDEVFHHLAEVLLKKGYLTTVGDEGGYAPLVKSGNTESIELILEAVSKAGYKAEKDFVIGLDIAASELFEDGKYTLKREDKVFSTDQMINWLSVLVDKYPIRSIEDGLSESDWQGWSKLTEKLGSKMQLVGDDLLVTNTKFLEKAIKEKAGNAILIKPNQIGTLTEAINVLKMAKKASWKTIISHRSGETEDTTIADLAVGLSAGQIKTGSLSRSERIAKYNQLLRIEEELGTKAKFAGSEALS
ncbi:phosphopyruvate hydratase [Candidatus Daviesbacteria bacterium]|nr:phosphopyruvate hydratase [Candidatus Daviesbacteria bacterium]